MTKQRLNKKRNHGGKSSPKEINQESFLNPKSMSQIERVHQVPINNEFQIQETKFVFTSFQKEKHRTHTNDQNGFRVCVFVHA